MYTAMAFVALTMGSLSPTPAFHDDYRAAQAKVTVAGKPMAVFVGSGKAGWESVVREGGFDPAVTKLLNEKFVCLYVDSSTPAGKTLAGAFQVGNRGVVLSDRTGLTQAYSAAGTVTRTELTRALVAYADTKDAPRTTETKGLAPVAGAPHGAAVAPSGGVVLPQGTYAGAPTGYGAPAGYGAGPAGYGGGCGQPAGCGQGGYGHSKGNCFFGGGSKCGFGGGCGHQTHCAPAPAPAPCAQPACGPSQGHGCCFFGGGSKCGFGGYGGGSKCGHGGYGGGSHCGGGFGGGHGGGCCK